MDDAARPEGDRHLVDRVHREEPAAILEAGRRRGSSPPRRRRRRRRRRAARATDPARPARAAARRPAASAAMAASMRPRSRGQRAWRARRGAPRRARRLTLATMRPRAAAWAARSSTRAPAHEARQRLAAGARSGSPPRPGRSATSPNAAPPSTRPCPTSLERAEEHESERHHGIGVSHGGATPSAARARVSWGPVPWRPTISARCSSIRRLPTASTAAPARAIRRGARSARSGTRHGWPSPPRWYPARAWWTRPPTASPWTTCARSRGSTTSVSCTRARRRSRPTSPSRRPSRRRTRRSPLAWWGRRWRWRPSPRCGRAPRWTSWRATSSTSPSRRSPAACPCRGWRGSRTARAGVSCRTPPRPILEDMDRLPFVTPVYRRDLTVEQLRHRLSAPPLRLALHGAGLPLEVHVLPLAADGGRAALPDAQRGARGRGDGDGAAAVPGGARVLLRRRHLHRRPASRRGHREAPGPPRDHVVGERQGQRARRDP